MYLQVRTNFGGWYVFIITHISVQSQTSKHFRQAYFSYCDYRGLLHKIVRFETYLPVGTNLRFWYIYISKFCYTKRTYLQIHSYRWVRFETNYCNRPQLYNYFTRYSSLTSCSPGRRPPPLVLEGGPRLECLHQRVHDSLLQTHRSWIRNDATSQERISETTNTEIG